MNEQIKDAAKEAVRFRSLCPRVNDDQETFILRYYKALPIEVARRVTDEFVSMSSFWDPALFFKLIKDLSDPRSHDERLAAEYHNARIRRQEILDERAAVDAFWKTIDDALSKVPAADLSRLQAEAIESLPDGLRDGARRRGMADAVVKAKIYEAVTAPCG